MRRAIREDKWRLKTPRDVPLVSCGLFTSAEGSLQVVVDETSAFLETVSHDVDAATVPRDSVPRPLKSLEEDEERHDRPATPAESPQSASAEPA